MMNESAKVQFFLLNVTLLCNEKKVGIRKPPGIKKVICTGFEPVTSCLSSKRSKPTELTDRLSKRRCKNTLFSI